MSINRGMLKDDVVQACDGILFSHKKEWNSAIWRDIVIEIVIWNEVSQWKNILIIDNHSGLVTHLEPHILDCKVKWASGSIIMNKTSQGDGIPVKLIQILKDGTVKVLHSICQQI